MRPYLLVSALTLLLTGCQIYAGGGTLLSDGRTTTIRTSEAEAGTVRGPRVRSTRTIIQEE